MATADTIDPAVNALLEALVELDRAEGGLYGLLLGMPVPIALAHANELPQLANVWERFAALAAAVLAELKEADQIG